MWVRCNVKNIRIIKIKNKSTWFSNIEFHNVHHIECVVICFYKKKKHKYLEIHFVDVERTNIHRPKKESKIKIFLTRVMQVI